MDSLQELAWIRWREIIDRFKLHHPDVLDKLPEPLLGLRGVGLDSVLATIVGVPEIVRGPLVAGFRAFHLLCQTPQGLLRGLFIFDELFGGDARGGKHPNAWHPGEVGLQRIRIIA